MHEVITVQFGQKSNYLASHFWNTQESYFTYSGQEESIVDHDIHFRTGIGANGAETFTPRTVIYDLKSGFGSLRKINVLYENEEPDPSQALWNKPAIIHRNPAIEKCDYQQRLEQGSEQIPITSDSVRYWSDFNRVYFHPRSIVQVHEYELDSTATMTFDKWSAGEELFQSMDKEYDLLERDMRPFVEEADLMQGIQMITSTDDAWGGFAARYFDHINDEYGKTGTFIWALEDSIENMTKEKRSVTLSNTARSISEIASQASLFVPIKLPLEKLPPHVTVDKSSRWHISALLSVAVESIALHTRLKSTNRYRRTFDNLECSLNTNGSQNISRLRLSTDQTVLNSNSPYKNTDQAVIDFSTPIRCKQAPSHHCNQDFRKLESESNSYAYEIDFFSCNTGEQIMERPDKKTHIFGRIDSLRKDFDQEDLGRNEGLRYGMAQNPDCEISIVNQLKIPLPFPLLDSFPPVFNQASYSRPFVAVAASLTTDTAIASRLKSLERLTKRIVGVEEREVLSNSLGEFAEAYVEGWESGSDEGEDF